MPISKACIISCDAPVILPEDFYASSIHAVGYHSVTGDLDETISIQPDTLYGVSAFGRHWRASISKFGIESACVRIAASRDANHRMLATWLSYDDLVRLGRVFAVPVLVAPSVRRVGKRQEMGG